MAAALAVALAGRGGPEDVTVEEFRQMDDNESVALLGCQIDKYAEERGKKKAERYFMEHMEVATKEKGAGDVTPLQVELIEEEGISCTRSEMARYQEG